MKILSSVVLLSAIFFVLGSSLCWWLNRPQVYVDPETNQLKHAIMPDEDGNTIYIKDYRDPRYSNLRKKGRWSYDVIPVR